MSRARTSDIPKVDDQFREADKQRRLLKWLVHMNVAAIAVLILLALHLCGVPVT